jgi:hypothetical protein
MGRRRRVGQVALWMSANLAAFVVPVLGATTPASAAPASNVCAGPASLHIDDNVDLDPPGPVVHPHFSITQSSCSSGSFSAGLDGYGFLDTWKSCELMTGSATTNSGSPFSFTAVGGIAVFTSYVGYGGGYGGFHAVGLITPDSTKGGDCVNGIKDFTIIWLAIDGLRMPQGGTGGPGPFSGTCNSGQISEGGLAGVYHRIYVEQAAPGTTWVCFRVDGGGGYEVGGRIVVQSVSGSAPRTDTNAAACGTSGWNGMIGPHPLANGTTGGVSYLVDIYSGGGEVWVCVAVGGNGTRVIVPVGPGPAVAWDLD